MADEKTTVCPRCNGDGFYFSVPSGFNAFSAGGWATAKAARKYICDCVQANRRQDGGVQHG